MVRGPVRSGFTLIEMMVAVTVTAVGLLALAGTSGALLRLTARSRLEAQVTRAAQARLEWLASRSCDAVAGGGIHAASVSERWTVDTSAGAARVQAAFTYTEREVSRERVHETRMRCRAP